MSRRPAAVVVNHDAGDLLLECVASMRADGVGDVVVVDNASTDGSPERLAQADPMVRVVRAEKNLGYGAGANRGLALVAAEFVLVSNPDVIVHGGAFDALVDALAADPTLALVGPRIEDVTGTRYPSARRFPSWVDAAGHAVLGQLAPGNRFTRRYRMEETAQDSVTDVDWVSGACFLARKAVLDELGGFDERYFMYLEDVDLCWRARRLGYGVAYVPMAAVTHVQGHSTSRRPLRMLLEHHRSAFRFASRRSTGWRRLLLPAVGLLLALRFPVALVRQLAGAPTGPIAAGRTPGARRRAD